jgi:hypothetical protein
VGRSPIDNADPHRPTSLPGRTAKKRGALAIDCLDHAIGLGIVGRSGGVRMFIQKSDQSLIERRVGYYFDLVKSAQSANQLKRVFATSIN